MSYAAPCYEPSVTCLITTVVVRGANFFKIFPVKFMLFLPTVFHYQEMARNLASLSGMRESFVSASRVLASPSFTEVSLPSIQFCGTLTFWCGSGSADPCLWLMDPDPGSGSCYFRHCLSRCQQKTNFSTQYEFFLLITFWRYPSFFKDKKKKRVTK